MPTVRLSLRTKLIYAAPALPLAMLGLPLLVILPDFWAGSMHMNLATVGFVLTLVRIFDVIVDPAIGRFSDLSHSRFGRRKPFMAVAMPVAAIGAVGLFFPPHGAGALWLFVFYALVTWGWTALSLPYWAWGAELSDDYTERQRITSLREGGTIVGILISAIAPVALGITSHVGQAHLLSLLTIGLATPFVLFALLLVPDKLPTRRTAPAGLGPTLKLVASNGPFRRLILAWAVNGLANGLPAALILIVFDQILHTPAASGPLLLVYFAAGVISVPFWLKLAARIGKHQTWAAAMAMSGIAFAFVPAILHVPHVLILFGIISVFTGAGLGADFTIPPAIQADVVDVDEAASGEQRAGIYFAAATMAQKAGNALAPGLAFPLLGLVGFSTHGGNDAMQDAALMVLYCGIPSALKIVAALIMRRFPIDRAAQQELRTAIAAQA
ncbi:MULTISPECIES: MFS transporter [Acidiphilium]|uniref:Na+/melibiose symporter n=1 Tax=Acidiphilium rubrum TaxID=526 RepID=A0A8G2CIL2_ACIRU|nr:MULTISPECIES: MFS transporter [Acidiphilium]SIQ29834.1 Na+/melibiose symporter [Acidiphilium rubrum]